MYGKKLGLNGGCISQEKNKMKNTKNIRILFIHIAVGMGIFYFLIHPLLMAVNANRLNQNDYEFWVEIRQLILQSFSFKMLPMTYVFIISGAILGLISGITWIIFLKNKKQIQLQNEIISLDIQSLIDSGESSYVEFKSTIRYDINKNEVNKNLEEVIGKTIVGFLNSGGGKLIIGVDDSGEILGLEKDFQTLKQKDSDGFEQKIYDIISNKIGVIFYQSCLTLFHTINSKEVCLIHIKPGLEPAFLNQNGETVYYVRMGNSTRKLSVKEAINHITVNKNN